MVIPRVQSRSGCLYHRYPLDRLECRNIAFLFRFWKTRISTFGLDIGYSEILSSSSILPGTRGGVEVEALRYKLEGRGIDSRWCQRNFSFT
jgi:hypothetical protein